LIEEKKEEDTLDQSKKIVGIQTEGQEEVTDMINSTFKPQIPLRDSNLNSVIIK